LNKGTKVRIESPGGGGWGQDERFLVQKRD
jgi:N-methylhydantoinase B/oxoprolinase/acetone carboxylase alpha subunit